MRYKPMDKADVAMRIKCYIKKERNFRNPHLTISMVADALGIARSTVVKVFKEEMHTTFQNYVDNCRVRHSRHLVVQYKGRFSMEHIAAVSGYGSRQTFSRKYREAYGESPNDTVANYIIKV
ncbi:MAG: helix-turn-helix transcriptional regulator [Prevotellaceae bacterium]|nr:helix-turn-helix transcriptional regulator [Prevotellaceae bacterium]